MLHEFENFDVSREKFGRLINFENNEQADLTDEASTRPYSINKRLYFAHYDLHIFPDDYDVYLRGFSGIIEQFIDFFVEMFKPSIPENAVHKKFDDHRRTILTNITRICFRLERRIFKAFVRGFKTVYTNSSNSFEKELKLTFCGYIFLEKGDINLPNLYIISKMYILFYQHVVYQTYFDLTMKTFDKIFNHFKAAQQASGRRSQADAKEDMPYFKQLKYIFRQLQWYGSKTHSGIRRKVFDFLIKTLELEKIFNMHMRWRFTLRKELTYYLNKYANTLLYDHIKAQSSSTGERSFADSQDDFYLLYDFIADYRSICLRERVSREMIEEHINVRPRQNSERWLRLLYEITHRSAYYMRTSQNFQGFFSDFVNDVSEPKNIQTNFFFDEGKIFYKLLINYVKQNPENYTQLKILIKMFLQRDEFSARRITSVMTYTMNSSEQFNNFVQEIINAIRVLMNPEVSDVKVSSFFLLQVATQMITQLTADEPRKILTAKLYPLRLELSEVKKYQPENLNVILEFFKFLFKTVTFNVQNPEDNNFIKEYLLFFNEIYKDPHDLYRQNKLLSLLIFSIMLSKYPFFFNDNIRWSMYTNYFNHLKDWNDESFASILVEGLKTIIPMLPQNNQHNEWFKLFKDNLYIFNQHKLPLTILMQRNCWDIALALRALFRDNVMELYSEDDNSRQILHHGNLFLDRVLGMFWYYVAHEDSPEVRKAVSNPRFAFMSDILVGFIAVNQKSIKNVEKFYALLKLAICYFSDEIMYRTRIIEMIISRDPKGPQNPHIETTIYFLPFQKQQFYIISLLAELLPQITKDPRLEAVCDQVIDYFTWLSLSRMTLEMSKVHQVVEHLRVILNLLFLHGSKHEQLLKICHDSSKKFNEQNVEMFGTCFWLIGYFFACKHIKRLPEQQFTSQIIMRTSIEIKKVMTKRILNGEVKLSEQREKAKSQGKTPYQVPEEFSSENPITNQYEAYRFLLISHMQLVIISGLREPRIDKLFQELQEHLETPFFRDYAFKNKNITIQHDILDMLIPTMTKGTLITNKEFESLAIPIEMDKYNNILNSIFSLERNVRKKTDQFSNAFLRKMAMLLLKVMEIDWAQFKTYEPPVIAQAPDFLRTLVMCAWNRLDSDLLKKCLQKFSAPKTMDRLQLLTTRLRTDSETFSVLNLIVFFKLLEDHLQDAPLALEFGHLQHELPLSISHSLLQVFSSQKRNSDLILSNVIECINKENRTVEDQKIFLLQLYDHLINEDRLEEKDSYALLSILLEMFPDAAKVSTPIAILSAMEQSIPVQPSTAVQPDKFPRLTFPSNNYGSLLEPILSQVYPNSLTAGAISSILSEQPPSICKQMFSAKCAIKMGRMHKALSDLEDLVSNIQTLGLQNEGDFRSKQVDLQVNHMHRASLNTLTEWTKFSGKDLEKKLRETITDTCSTDHNFFYFLREACNPKPTIFDLKNKTPFISVVGYDFRNLGFVFAEEGEKFIEKVTRTQLIIETWEQLGRQIQSIGTDTLTAFTRMFLAHSRKKLSPCFSLSSAIRILNTKSITGLIFARDLQQRFAKGSLDMKLEESNVEPLCAIQMAHLERKWGAIPSIKLDEVPTNFLAFTQFENALLFYKELYFQGKSTKADEILYKLLAEIGNMNEFKEARNSIVSICAEMKANALVTRNGPQEAMTFISELISKSNTFETGKIFLILFNIYATALEKDRKNAAIIVEMIKALSKANETDPLTSKKVYLVRLASAIQRLDHQSTEVSEALRTFFSAKENVKFVKVNLQEIFILFDKSIVIEALNSRMYSNSKNLYYQIYNIKYLLDNSEILNHLGERLPDNFLLMPKLLEVLEDISSKKKYLGVSVIKKLTEMRYRMKIIARDLCQILINHYDEIADFLNELRNMDLQPHENTEKMLEFFDQWADLFFTDRILVNELMNEKKIAVLLTPKSLLKPYHTAMLEEVSVSPYITIKGLSTEVVLDICLFKQNGKKIPLRIFMDMVKSEIDNCKLAAIKSLLFEQMSNSPLAFRIPSPPVPLFLFLKEGWYGIFG